MNRHRLINDNTVYCVHDEDTCALTFIRNLEIRREYKNTNFTA